MGVKIRFKDGKEVEVSLLVGADGTRSGIKKQLLPTHKFVNTEGTTVLRQDNLDSRATRNLLILGRQMVCVFSRINRRIHQSLCYWRQLDSRTINTRRICPQTPFTSSSELEKIIFDIDSAGLLKLNLEEAALETKKLTANWPLRLSALSLNSKMRRRHHSFRIDSALPELAPFLGDE